MDVLEKITGLAQKQIECEEGLDHEFLDPAVPIIALVGITDESARAVADRFPTRTVIAMPESASWEQLVESAGGIIGTHFWLIPPYVVPKSLSRLPADHVERDVVLHLTDGQRTIYLVPKKLLTC